MLLAQPGFKTAPLVLAVFLALSSPSISLAQTTGTAVYTLSIASQPLEAALNELSALTGTAIGFSPAVVADKTARALHDTVTVRQAVEHLLAGSGLVAVPQGNGVVVKTASDAQDVVTLAPVVTLSGRDASTDGTGSYAPVGPSRTATGLSLSWRETPQSVTVMTRQRMDDFKLETLTDVMEQTPGIGVYRQNNATDFQARGSSVNLQTDGMSQVSSGWYYLSSTLYSLDDMAEIDRIEVLKGSSGLVMGKGNYGATVNLLRKKPTREFQASVNASAGSWDNYRAQADISGPLNQTASVRGRLVASAMDAGGFRANEKSNSKMLYGTVEADVGPNTLVNVGMTYRDRKAQGIGTTQPIQRYTNSGEEVPWMPRSYNTGAPWGQYGQQALNLFGSVEQRLGADWSAALKFSHQRVTMDNMVAGYIYDYTRASFGRWRDMQNRNWTVNLDVKGPFTAFGREHELLLGAGISRYRSNVQLPLNPLTLVPLRDLGVSFAQGGGGLVRPDDDKWTYRNNSFNQKQRYVYAAGRFQLADPLSVIGGARVTQYEELDITPYWWNYDMKENGVITPYAGLIYDVLSNVSLYGSYTNIFQPQTAQDEQGKTLSPEQGNTYEMGVKGEFFDGRLNASVARFWMRTKNTAEQTGALTPGGDTAYRAVSDVMRRGWEVELTGELSPGWQLQGSLVQQSSSLNTASRYPKYQFKLGTTYRFNTSRLHGLTVGAAARWQSKTAVSNDHATLSQSSYALLDVMARYQVDRHLSFGLNLNNVLDKRYLAGVNSFNRIGLYYTWGAPRNVLASMRYEF